MEEDVVIYQETVKFPEVIRSSSRDYYTLEGILGFIIIYMWSRASLETAFINFVPKDNGWGALGGAFGKFPILVKLAADWVSFILFIVLTETNASITEGDVLFSTVDTPVMLSVSIIMEPVESEFEFDFCRRVNLRGFLRTCMNWRSSTSLSEPFIGPSDRSEASSDERQLEERLLLQTEGDGEDARLTFADLLLPKIASASSGTGYPCWTKKVEEECLQLLERYFFRALARRSSV
ncbi:hypothetical protein EVAR_2723_1 [Eumeta japonica]|uniref:Uncharacterized protein n=1 Tax=Eumeta variegata TaxID=151549 RepID=A0A4C1T210_EUMVA|nr:hypothetical protein EVAR_2723_1 [Eumeta japonica]